MWSESGSDVYPQSSLATARLPSETSDSQPWLHVGIVWGALKNLDAQAAPYGDEIHASVFFFRTEVIIMFNQV